MLRTGVGRISLLSRLTHQNAEPLYSDVPRPTRDKSERKPYPTPMKTLIRRAKEEREARRLHPCRILEHPPDNGLLVPHLIDVAHRVYRSHESLLRGISKLLRVVPLQRCMHCFEVHVGQTGHEIRTCTGPNSGFRSARHVWRRGRVQDVIFFPKSFHLRDRVGKPRVGHDEQGTVPRIPAVLELCIQAGLDLPKYPTKRRTRPVYSIDGRIVDFEPLDSSDDTTSAAVNSTPPSVPWIEDEDIKKLSIRTLGWWFEMISGVGMIMEKYSVLTCGYCPDVQVGPKGHKARVCKGSKHQSRNGLHAWQEATVNDVVGPNYVWHVLDQNESSLNNNLKRYYGKAPALVELCVQAGAPVPDEYRSMMRLDVVRPDRDEVDLVA